MTIIVLRLCGLNQNATVGNFYLGIQVFMAKLIITEKNSSRGLVFQTRKKAGGRENPDLRSRKYSGPGYMANFGPRSERNALKMKVAIAWRRFQPGLKISPAKRDEESM